MHPIAFRKAMIDAYMAGFGDAIESGTMEHISKLEARDWFDNMYGTLDIEDCACCDQQETDDE